MKVTCISNSFELVDVSNGKTLEVVFTSIFPESKRKEKEAEYNTEIYVRKIADGKNDRICTFDVEENVMEFSNDN